MSGHDDYSGSMAEPPLDENVADSLVSASTPPAGSDLRAVADVLDDLRATTSEPPGPPSAALAAVLRDGLPVASPAPVPGPDRRTVRPAGWRSWGRVVAPIGVGLTLTAGTLTAAAAADLLPDAAQRVVATVVNTITPLDLPEPGRGDPAPETSDPVDAGTQSDGSVGGSEAGPGGEPSPGPASTGTTGSQGSPAGPAAPRQGPSAPAADAPSLPPAVGLEPFPDPSGTPSAGVPPPTVPGAPPGDGPGTLPLPTTPTTVATPDLANPPQLPAP